MPQDKLTAVRIKQANGSYGPQIPVGAKAENVKYDNLYTVKEVLGNVDTTKGPLQEQIDNIDTSAIGAATDAWLDENVTPSVNAILDTSLTLENYAADAKAAGKLVAINDETDATSTKLHFNTNNQIVNIATMDDVPDVTQIIAPAYSASSTYAVGDHVIYDGKVYECKTAISTTEAWTAVHWTAVKVEGQIEDLKEVLNIITIPVDQTGHYISGTGTYSTSTNGRMSQAIEMSAGEILTVDYSSGTTVSIGVIAKVEDNTYTVLVANGASASNKHFEYKATDSVSVVVSALGDSGAAAKVYKDANIVLGFDHIRNMPSYAYENQLPVSFSAITLVRENGYRKSNGTIEGTTTIYFHSSFDLQTGDIIYLHYKNAPTSVVILGYFDTNDDFHVVRRGDGGSSEGDIRFVAPSNISVSVSGSGSSFSVFAVSQVEKNSQPINELLNTLQPTIIAASDSRVPWQYAIDNILCIGDSLTYGVPPDTTNMPNPMKQNYPFYLGRMINAQTTNAGKSGKTTSQWYTTYYSDYDMSDYNAVIICLGTNAPLTDTIDTDVDPYEDYNDYATTETGYYCRLIKNIQHDNSNAIIVLVNIWGVATGTDTTRTVIDKIGAKYSLPVVYTYDLRYAANPAYHGNWDNVHMTKTGYLALAHRISMTLKDYFAVNTSQANKGMTQNS